MRSHLLTSLALALIAVPSLTLQSINAVPTESRIQSAPTQTESENEIRSLEEQMDALLRSNDRSRTALWADDLVYIGNDAAMHNKADLTRAVAGGEVNVESLEVSQRRIRVYGDLAIVTGMEQRRASFDTKPQDETLQYTRVWARRSSAWRVVSFQETKVVQGPRPPLAGFEACSSAQLPPPTPGSLEQMILKLDYDQALANTAMFKGDEATRAALGFGMVAEDYVAINGSGNFGDKAGAMRRYGPGGVKILSEKFANMRARVFGDAAIVTGTWCIRSVREGTVEAPPGAAVGTEMTGATRITRVWVKRNGEWKVVSWQGTGIPKQESAPEKTALPTNDTSHAQHEAAIRKRIAHTDRMAGIGAISGSPQFTECCDHISVAGKWRSSRQWATTKRLKRSQFPYFHKVEWRPVERGFPEHLHPARCRADNFLANGNGRFD